jgi:hypothetical protein
MHVPGLTTTRILLAVVALGLVAADRDGLMSYAATSQRCGRVLDRSPWNPPRWRTTP